jgi:WD40 repeat protein
LAFSHDGKYLAASDMSDDHFIAIFDAKVVLKPGQKWTPIAHSQGTKSVIMSLGWSSTNDTVIATCVKELKFFSFSGGQITAKKATGFGTKPCDTVLSQATVGNTLFTGHMSGEIISWNGTSLAKR